MAFGSLQTTTVSHLGGQPLQGQCHVHMAFVVVCLVSFHCHPEIIIICGGLIKNGPHRLGCLNAYSYREWHCLKGIRRCGLGGSVTRGGL